MDNDVPANAGDIGSLPGWARFHVLQSNWAHVFDNFWVCAATTEALAPKGCALQRDATMRRSPRTAMKSSPYLLQLGKQAHTRATKTQHSQR